jgi:hypothetical protein
LRWPDIDLDGAFPCLRVRSALRRFPGGEALAEPKARSKRTVTLPEECSSALRDHKRRQDRERLLAGEDWQEVGFVFTTGTGLPVSENTVSRWFTRLRSHARIEHGRLYDCRHTAASLLLAQGVHPRVIMDVLGHSTFRLTMDTYAQSCPPPCGKPPRPWSPPWRGPARRRDGGAVREMTGPCGDSQRRRLPAFGRVQGYTNRRDGRDARATWRGPPLAPAGTQISPMTATALTKDRKRSRLDHPIDRPSPRARALYHSQLGEISSRPISNYKTYGEERSAGHQDQHTYSYHPSR